MKSIFNRQFQYTTASESSKPGYLRRKFERIRREMREAETMAKLESSVKVRQIKKAAP